MRDKIWAFEYCSCIYEAGYTTISLHRTAKGARKARKEFSWKRIEAEMKPIHNWGKWWDDGPPPKQDRDYRGVDTAMRVVPVEVKE